MDAAWIALISAVSVEMIREGAGYLKGRRSKKYNEEDKRKDEEEEQKKKIEALVKSNKFLMLDKIEFLGLKFVDQGEISIDHRKRLNAMHDVYHNELNGNGDLDAIMEQVNGLPIKR